MPTYEYKCSACGHAFEKFQSITAAALRKCPECGKGTLRRLIGTGAGVIFRGGGFYETDYRSDSYKAGAKAEGSHKSGDKEKPAEKSGGKEGQSSSGSSEAKPAADGGTKAGKQSKRKSA